MKHLGLAAALLSVMCESSFAASWYMWTDASGRVQTTRDRPSLGTPYREITVPDPVRWSNPPDMPAQITSGQRDSVQEIFKVASQSVYWILRRTPSSSGSQSVVYGSAVAISEDLALTNCHVIGGPGDDAILGSGNSADQSAVELVAANVEADRCVVRTRDLRLRPVPGIRPFDSLEIGETVYAIGNPQRLELTMSDGLLSGKRVAADRRLVQTTAPISPGSSGGGLFDTRGNLVGITVSSRRDAQNINFAIPAEDFWR